MANSPYTNFFLSNEIEDQYASRLDLQRFCKIDNDLEGRPGLVRKINVYSATDSVEKVAKGYGNTQTSEASYAQKEYTILTAQGRFEYKDEDEMADPMIVVTGVQHLGVDMFNTVNGDAFAEFNKAVLTTLPSAVDFDAFADAVAMMNLEEIEGIEINAFVNPADLAALRKSLKGTLQYVEAFARNGYVGTVAGVNIYTKKNAVKGTIVVATNDAVTIFNKKGVEVERPARSTEEANIRQNWVYARKYYLAALTNEAKAVKMLVGGTATACPSTETTVDSDKTYYEKSGIGYIKVTPAVGDNPYSKGWYTIA